MTNQIKTETQSPQSTSGAATPGKLELVIKINQLPESREVENGWRQFALDCDGQIVSVTVRPKMWKKLTDAQANWSEWVAAIAGKMGDRTETGFVLNEPNIQTFERKPKEPKEQGEG